MDFHMHINILFTFRVGIIGGASKASFEIPARLLNITMCRIQGQKKMLEFRRFLKLFSAVTIPNSICGVEWDIL